MNSRIINKDCIVPHLNGRLGNNMFMIAHAYAEALKQNKQLIVPKHQVGHMHEFLDNIFRKLDTYISLPSDVDDQTATVYGGYFQSESYFSFCSEAVKQLFSPTLEFINTYQSLLHSPNTAISVRRGDYLIYQDWHPVITKEYIEKAITFIPQSEYYYIFSDDIPWCKANLDLPNCHFVDFEVHEQMWLMAMCDNFIISNSSFSWWGAYLSRNPYKIVIAPETWFGPSGPKSWNDMYCKGWVVLPTYYKDGFIYPK